MRGAKPAAVGENWDAVAWASAQVSSSVAPALVARADGMIVAANAAAEPLILRGALQAQLHALVIDTRFKNCVKGGRVLLAEQSRCFDLTLLPLTDGHVLAVGRDATFDANLISALAVSRDLFRDLALSFADVAFETDAAGAFSWMSSGGMLGFDADELHGARPCELFGEAAPFSTREPVNGREIWLKTKSGQDNCLVLTVSPLVDRRGWCGARGVARDVTPLKLLEREAAAAQKRDELISAVVGALRAQIEPRRMMLAAADALAAAAEADAVSICALGSGPSVSVGAKTLGLARAIDVATSYQGKPNGNVRLAREAAKGGFSDAARSLIEAVAPHLGVALALVQSLESSGAVRRDGATGLLNRRAFFEEANRKCAAAARAGRDLTLIVFDCDEFEERDGAPGEQTLAAVGRALAQRCGADDVAGALDEDEFALATDASSNLELAENIRADLAEAARRHCAGASISAGSAVAAADGDETLENLFRRAECALHTAKREGRNRAVSAEVSLEVTSCSND
jgi:diguanylate cyclase (GGDEF)-like protein